MADEPILDAGTQTVEAETIAAPAETKKRRSPAKRKESAAPVAKETLKAAPAGVKSKSRRHTESERADKLSQIERRLGDGATLKAASKEAGISEQTFYQWKRSAPSSAANVKVAKSAPQGDSLTELMELEAENLRLRGLLSQKLRAENGELRKRLGLG